MKIFPAAFPVAALTALVALSGCSPAGRTPIVPVPVAAVTPASPADAPPLAIHWFRNSAEMRSLYIEIYRAAGDQLMRLASSAAPGTWAVILDADETVLDNSLQQKEQAAIHAAYSDSAWRIWVRKEAAPALPGSTEFIDLAHQLGGRVVIVSNREAVLCDATRSNFIKDSLEVDAILCKAAVSDKNPRFESVENGTAAPNLPRLKVLMWIGDNIQDFPRMTQAARSAFDSAYANFGRTWFLLPNPMYGSWERVEYR